MHRRSSQLNRALSQALAVAIVAFAPALARAQDARPKPAGTAPELVRQAMEAAGDGDYPWAVGLVEKAALVDPKARRPVLMIATFATIGADHAVTVADKLVFLRKSSAARARLNAMGGTPDPQEESILERTRLDEVRILTLDGQPGPALDALVKLVEGGYDDLTEIEDSPDLKAVRALPDYRPRLDKALLPGIKAAIAATKPFAFDFDLKDSDGKATMLADFRGNVTIVDVWGTWCPPCRKEIPHFVDLASRYGTRGLKMVGINCNEDGTPAEVAKTINDFKAENKMAYPCLINDETVEKKIPNFQGYPTTIFLDRKGKVRLVLVGYTPMSRLELIVSTLLGEPTPK